jgi:hypothetical protein
MFATFKPHGIFLTSMRQKCHANLSCHRDALSPTCAQIVLACLLCGTSLGTASAVASMPHRQYCTTATAAQAPWWNTRPSPSSPSSPWVQVPMSHGRMAGPRSQQTAVCQPSLSTRCSSHRMGARYSQPCLRKSLLDSSHFGYLALRFVNNYSITFDLRLHNAIPSFFKYPRAC